ncbi:hypothetical protein B5P46_10410 [Rhizobium leguminosarum]|uniref:Uncharacterized protein n=1 Tax=Rhizobium leguminosarum TaxID=384 RepID=A0A4V1P2Y3_RHILE|nr:hypothetical protein B5P46_10410 [Rhizobium leguminosarum]
MRMAFMEISFRPVVLLNVSNRKVFLIQSAACPTGRAITFESAHNPFRKSFRFSGLCSRAPRVRQDALRTLYDFKLAHNPENRSDFGVMRWEYRTRKAGQTAGLQITRIETSVVRRQR